MPDPSEAGPSSASSSSSQQRPNSTIMSRRRSSSTRTSRTRPIRPRASSSISQRSDASNLSSGLQQLSWTTGDCFDYVDDDARISAFLHCPICLGPFLDPYASMLCSHTFCKHCITTALSDSSPSNEAQDDPLVASVNKRCPTCRTSVELTDFQPTALLIKNMVDTLRVRCPNKSKGCDYECERHLLRGHVASDCASEYVDQNLNEGRRCGCSAKVMRKDWATHGVVCPKRKIACPTCDAVLCADELEQHCQTCSPEPVQCEFCRVETIKSRLKLHVADECQEAPVLCPHSGFGCSWIGPRQMLSRGPDTASKSSKRTHLQDECRYEPIKGFFTVFTQHLTQLTDQNAALKARLEEIEARQGGQARRLDDCVHSLGSWYRSAGQLRGGTGGIEGGGRGSQLGVDGEWDEFPLDAQNWERSWSQQSFARHHHQQGGEGGGGRSHSASAVHSLDLANWARRQYDLTVAVGTGVEVISPGSGRSSGIPTDDNQAGSRYLAPPTARSMPNTSPLGAPTYTPSPTRERPSYLPPLTPDTLPSTNTTNTTTTTGISPSSLSFPPTAGVEIDNLDSVISCLTSTIAGLSSGLSSLDKRTEEGHIAAVKAGFDAGRVQEQVASLRHGLHAIRMQIHQLMMREQRFALFGTTPVGSGVATVGVGSEVGPSQGAVGSMPMLSPPLLRRWAGLEHTKL